MENAGELNGKCFRQLGFKHIAKRMRGCKHSGLPRWVVPLITESPLKDANIISMLPVDTEEWRKLLIDYLEHGKLPDDPKHCSEVQQRAPRFLYYKEKLYRRFFE